MSEGGSIMCVYLFTLLCPKKWVEDLQEETKGYGIWSRSVFGFIMESDWDSEQTYSMYSSVPLFWNGLKNLTNSEISTMSSKGART